MSASTSPVVERARKVAERLSKGVAYLMKKNKIEVIEGTRALAGAGAHRRDRRGRRALPEIAGPAHHPRDRRPGAHAARHRARRRADLDLQGGDGPASFPKSLLVVGSGAIGIEFASFYRALGAEVTLVEMLRPYPARRGRGDLRARAQGLRQRGSASIPGRCDEQLTQDADSVTATLAPPDGAPRSSTADRVILAVGITGNVEGLGLEEHGVGIERGHIVVDEWCRTGEPGALRHRRRGRPPWLAHKASHEGVLCVEQIAGVDGVHPLDKTEHPGLHLLLRRRSRASASPRRRRDAGAAKSGSAASRFSANGKAIALGETEGLMKTSSTPRRASCSART